MYKRFPVLPLLVSLGAPLAAQDCTVTSLESPFGQTVWSVVEYDGFYYDGGTRHINRRSTQAGAAWSEVPGGPDIPFAGQDPEVRDMVQFGDELVMVGVFFTAGGQIARCVTAWDGTSFRTLGSGVNNLVRDVVVWNGTLVISGEFTQNGAGTTNLSRVAMYDAESDSWQPMGDGLGGIPAGFSSGVQDLAVHNGEVHAVGRFRTSGGNTLNGVARFDAVSGEWMPLGSGIAGIANGQTLTGAVSHDGQLWVSGVFPSIGGVSIPSFYAVWDGTSWSEGPINNVAAHSFTMLSVDDVLYSASINGFHFGAFGTDFAFYDGQSWQEIGDTDSFPNTLNLTADGTGLLTGGFFQTFDGVQTGNVVLLECEMAPDNAVPFCDPAVANSTGVPAELGALGSGTAADNNLTLRMTSLPSDVFGFFLVSQTQGFQPGAGGSLGNLCLAGAIGRYVGPGQVQNSGTTGVMQLALDLPNTPTPSGTISVMGGETWNFQGWYRDQVGGASASNYSNGLEVQFD